MIHIIGGGLAGCEAAWQAASRGVPVTIHEMRPVRPTEVHKTDRLAELVCSNSFRGDKLDNAVGLLKEEMRRLDSLVHARRRDRPRAGRRGARRRSRAVRAHRDAGDPRASAHHAVARRDHVDSGRDTGVAGDRRHGPADVARFVGRHRRSSSAHEHLYFYDAISPIVLAETIDMRKVFRASRWNRKSARAGIGSRDRGSAAES